MHWPQITYLMLLAAALTRDLIKHGDKRTDRINFGTSLVASGITLSILYAGGFFDGA